MIERRGGGVAERAGFENQAHGSRGFKSPLSAICFPRARARSTFVRRQTNRAPTWCPGRWRDRGRLCTLGKRVCRKVPWVRIPPLRHFFHLCGGERRRAASPRLSARRWVRSHAMVRFRTGSGRNGAALRSSPGARCPPFDARRPSGPSARQPDPKRVQAPRAAPFRIGAILRAHVVPRSRAEVPAQGFSEVAGQDG